MKRLLLMLTVLLSCVSLTAWAQPVQVCLGNDTSVCTGQSVTINNCNNSSSNSGLILNAPTNVTLGDDNWSGLVNLGFTFNFYGTNYTQCVIGANGLVSFNLSYANAACPWTLDSLNPLPNVNVPAARGAAMGCYQDLNPTNGSSGPIQYQTIGTAPNRKFVVLYNGVTMFNCTSKCSYFGIIFYETSNVIEVHIGQKGMCSSWNNGLAVQAVERLDAGVADVTPGRNISTWSATLDGRRWTPTSPSNTTDYTITQIPYLYIGTAGATLMWKNTLGQTFPYNSGHLTVSNPPPVPTGYFLVSTSCGNPVGTVSDTTFITRITVNASATATADFCAGGSGTATAVPLQGGSPFTFLWTPGGQTTQTAVNLAAGNYQVMVKDAHNCGKIVTVTVPLTNASFTGSSTPVKCPGGSDGTASVQMTPAQGTLSYNWFDANGQTTQTATNLEAGTYHCKVSSTAGCEDTVEVMVSEIPGMVAQIDSSTNVTCYSFSNGTAKVDVNHGTSPYTYLWSVGGVTSDQHTALPPGTHSVTVTDSNNCTVSTSVTITQPNPLSVVNFPQNAVICPGDSTILTVTGTGGSSSYIYTWTQNGSLIGTGPTIHINPESSGSVYCVSLAEVCGSPSVDSCVTVTFPTPINPVFTPDVTWACQPGKFVFSNQSDNSQEIASVLLQYGDGNQEVWTGSSDIVHTYANSGSYDMNVTVTSVFGCTYSAYFPAIVSVIPKPEADFSFLANPTTIFETNTKLKDQSSGSIVSWEWNSPGSVPSYTTVQDPVLHFPEGIVANYPIQLIVETEEGCMDTTERLLIVNSGILFYAPNAFTIDGDNLNETWKFFANGVDAYNFEVRIYNRWGEVIWKTTDVHGEWDGKYKGELVPSGTYVWTASMKDPYSDMREEYNGSVVVLRSFR